MIQNVQLIKKFVIYTVVIVLVLVILYTAWEFVSWKISQDTKEEIRLLKEEAIRDEERIKLVEGERDKLKEKNKSLEEEKASWELAAIQSQKDVKETQEKIAERLKQRDEALAQIDSDLTDYCTRLLNWCNWAKQEGLYDKRKPCPPCEPGK